MKVYISKYRNHWLSPYKICDKICFWREVRYEESWVRLTVRLLDPVITAIEKVLDIVHPKIDYVKIDPWDTWSMDHTLAQIILPMLKQLRDTRCSYPQVNEEDVPESMKDDASWDWVLGEMIWAFEQVLEEDEFFNNAGDGFKRKSNGFRLFGKYYENLWD